MTREKIRSYFLQLVEKEIDHAYAKHGTELWGRHEFYGILKEEVDELWDNIKSDAPSSKLREELIQVAAMCLRYFETGDRWRGSLYDRV